VRQAATTSNLHVVGRERELTALRDFLESYQPALALVLSGGPGIGKTALWEAGIEAAHERGIRVLTTRASEAEAQFSFAGLSDLLERVDKTAFASLPAPQARALDVALLRAEPDGPPPEPRAIGTAFLNVLRALSSGDRILVAVDDLQWLDPASADALAFAARRLGQVPVGFLATARSRRSGSLELALENVGLERLEIEPLSLGATRRLLSERLGLSLPRRVLRRVFETTGGTPLFALELGRLLAERGLPDIGDELPVPDVVEDLLGARVASLPVEARRVLLAVALSPSLAVSELNVLAGTTAVDEAVDAGFVVLDGEDVRLSHPLLGAAATRHASAAERRDLHRELGEIVGDDELRARHLALATSTPDIELATVVAAAAARAWSRAAGHDAVELAGHALRLTPKGTAEHTERLLTLAGYLATAGEEHRLTELLAPRLDALPPGRARARAHLLLGEATDLAGHEEHLDRALAEADIEPALRATALATKARLLAATRIVRIAEAERMAQEALAAARAAGADVERFGLRALAWARILGGHPVDDLDPSDGEGASAYDRALVGHGAGIRLMFRGEVEQARSVFLQLRSLAEERGEGRASRGLHLRLCELELRAGDAEAASRLLADWEEWVSLADMDRPRGRCEALLAVLRGSADEAEQRAAQVIALAEAQGERWDVLEARRASGIAALLSGEPQRGANSLAVVWEHTQSEGVNDPGAFPVAPDLVEALVELDDVDRAVAVANRLEELAHQQEHPWGLPSAKRCFALVRLASGHDEQAVAALAEAADAYRALGLRFDHARSLLSLGRVQRRFKKWAAARTALEQAAAAFEASCCTGWVELTRSELERVGGRRPRSVGELTPTEQRVAELAAEGLANKEIARRLFVGVHTVELHLSHAYAKLGVRSRAQLARRLAARA
jgi:DNA-binding NarL/FixJ family response regulator